VFSLRIKKKNKKKDMKIHRTTEVQGGAGNQEHTKRDPQQKYLKKTNSITL